MHYCENAKEYPGKDKDVLADTNQYTTDFLSNEVLLPDNIPAILGDFFHLDIEEKETDKGLKYKYQSFFVHRMGELHRGYKSALSNVLHKKMYFDCGF